MPGFLDLARSPAAELRELGDRARALRRGLVSPPRVVAPVGLVCARPAPYVQASVGAAAALLGLRLQHFGPAEVEALGDRAVAGAILGGLHAALVTVGLDGDAFADASPAPIINAGDRGGDVVGALADLVVMEAGLGRLEGRKLAWVGDASGLLYDLLVAACTLGMNVAVAHPVGFAPDAERLTVARERAALSGAAVMVTTDLAEALQDAHAVYVEPWPEGAADRFRPYTVHRHALRHSHTGALLLHRAPERRGPEIATSLVEDGAWQALAQARARVDAAAALLLGALRPDPLHARMS